ALNQQIKSLMEEKPVLAAGAFSLKQMGALFERLDLFITADTGPLHIANSVGAKNIIALFGPTDVSVTGPYPADNCVIIQKNVGCKIPCYKVDCQTRRCMRAITPQDVLEQVKKIEWKK
ncbi:lipopolysaccharide heptosyltransferase, partial [bacterium]